MGTWEELIAAIDAVLAGSYDSPDAVTAEVAKIREAAQALLDSASAEGAASEDVEAAAKHGNNLFAKIKTAQGKIVAKRSVIELATKNREDLNTIKSAQGGTKSGLNVKDGAKITGKPYKGKGFKAYGQDAGEAAYRAGRQVAAAFGMDDNSKQWCKDNGVNLQYKTMTTDNDSLGGLLVVDELDEAIRYYREERGTARNNMEVITMQGPTRRINRNVGGTSVVAMGEGQTYSASDVSFNAINLTNKKFGGLTKNSYELGEDSFANLAEEIAKDHGYAHGVMEDKVALLGDGSSTYNGYIGVCESFKKLVTDAGGTWTTDAHKIYAAGVKVATGATLASVTDVDITGTFSKVATFSGLQTKIYTTSQVYFDVLVKLARAANGNTAQALVDGVTMNTYNGTPVVFIDELYTQNATEASSFVLFVGDMSQAGIFTDRTGLTFTTSTEQGYLSDDVYQKSMARYGVNWWNIGNASTTAASHRRGALAALVLKNS